MNPIIEQIANRENLFWAWEKVRYACRPGDLCFDELELVRFEICLETELEQIGNEIRSLKYKIIPIKPRPFPKPPDSDKKPRLREAFSISIKDQVAHMAMMNILGPYLDYKMPFWSYGNRLYKSVFYNIKEDGKREIKFGWYRHASRHIYKKWNQSWPLYRNHVAIVAKIMANTNKFNADPENFKENELDDDKQREYFDLNKQIKGNSKVRYLEKGYWPSLGGEIYWAGLDLTKFYPSTRQDKIIAIFFKHAPKILQTNDLRLLLESMMTFPLDCADWPKNSLAEIKLPQHGLYNGLPTGLLTAGFWANISLMEVDEKVNERLSKNKDTAHFRFVDDHVIISTEFKLLCDWIEWYKDVLLENGFEFNPQKTEPTELGKFLNPAGTTNNSEKEELLAKAERAAKLDKHFPSPLMTQTLAKVSKIAQANIDFLDEDEKDQLISDIEHLLITEFPDQELRRDTRVSFAAGRLSMIAGRRTPNIHKLYEIERELLETINELKIFNKKGQKRSAAIKNKLKVLGDRKAQLAKDRLVAEDEYRENDKSSRQRIIKLLLKAIRENHDKRSLWTRLIEYWQLSGHDEYESFFDTLEDLSKNKIVHKESLPYIYALIFQSLTVQIVNAYRRMLTQNSSYIAKEHAARFLEGIFAEKKWFQTKPLKSYDRQAQKLFKFAASSVIFLLKKEHNAWFTKTFRDYDYYIKVYQLFSWETDLNRGRVANSDFLSLSWWIINKTQAPNENTPNAIWLGVVREFNFKADIAEFAIAALYPKHVTEEGLKLMLAGTSSHAIYTPEAWKYDVISGYRQRHKVVPDIGDLRKIAAKTRNTITLDKWVHRLNWQLANLQATPDNKYLYLHFDPKYSEWTALEIVRQIIELHTKKFSSIDEIKDSESNENHKIHWANYDVPKQWLDASKTPQQWEKWRNIVENNLIKDLREKDKISDQRITPRFDGRETTDEMPAVRGLGIILTCLLSKDFDLPPSWNIPGCQRMWAKSISNKLESCLISSWTMAILEGCSSKRNYETALLSQVLHQIAPEDDDTTKDPIVITTLHELSDKIKMAQNTLVKYQLSVQDHMPRQLIPVSLLQISRNALPLEGIVND